MHGPAVVAHEAQGEERARLWQLGLQRVPAQLGNQWTDNPHRRIPVMVLSPVPRPPGVTPRALAAVTRRRGPLSRNPQALRRRDQFAGTWWLDRQPGRERDVEQAYRDAAAAGDPDALKALDEWLSGQPGRQAEAALIRRVGLDARGATACAVA